MAINVELQSERGEVLADLADPTLVEELTVRASPDSICLRFIDPYQDTTFNEWQTSQLVRELRALDGLPDSLRSTRDAHVALAERVTTHTYLKFIGD